MRALIIGCGYVGLPLGAELARRGHEVFGVRRSAGSIQELQQWGITPVIADITRPEDFAKIPGPFDWVVNTVSSSKGGVEDYRAVYLETTRHLIAWLGANPPRKYVYTSSTSVYAQTDGSWVTEESPAEPASETSRVLMETEQLLLQSARESNFPAMILRVAGIYGPERGHLFQQYLRGEARLAGNGSRLINMVHRDDVVNAAIAALERGRAGEVYNVADDEPVSQREFFLWLSDKLGKPMPPPVTDEIPQRKRGVTHKRVFNRKLRLELGCELKYLNFRLGYSAEIARLQAAGLLPAGAGE
ncbi:MAG TPA: SDR family oxidoreductase [Candidatus Limnocylindria bacterium]|nr:SDR family oxidoreductase [Candidatus Limnocylindria bacterium]